MRLADRIIARITRRPPDFIIGGRQDPYLFRWFVLPRNPVFNVYLHQFARSDDERAHHDHPWLFNASLILRGSYLEHTIRAGGIAKRTLRRAGSMALRWGPAPHRIELLADSYGGPSYSMRPCWTLFITGPRVRSWGFHCPEQGWIRWDRFTAASDPGATGKGCDA
jgi:hypothetical protein